MRIEFQCLVLAILAVVMCSCTSGNAESAYFQRDTVSSLANGQKMITMHKKYLGEWVQNNSTKLQIVTIANLGEVYFTVVFHEVQPQVEKK